MTTTEKIAFQAWVADLTAPTSQDWVVDLSTDPTADIIVRHNSQGEPRTPLMRRADVVISFDQSISLDAAKKATIARLAGRITPSLSLLEV